MKVIVPPIKSQGIKTKLVPYIQTLIPKDYNRWIEPFMGTGVVGFNIASNHSAHMSDTNPHMITFYREIQKGIITPENVKHYLHIEGEKLKKSNGEYFYEVRKRFNEEHKPLDFLFLTRSCFNGMIRFNKSAQYNVPFCKKPERFSQAYVTKIVNQVKNCKAVFDSGDFHFEIQDFTDSIRQAKKGDLIYCDPPYIDRHGDFFNGWNEEKENELYEALSNTEASFILSTWDHNKYRENEFLRTLWNKYPRVTRQHFYHVGGSKNNRGSMVEAFVYSPNLKIQTFQN